MGVDMALEAPAPLWAIGAGLPPGTSSGFVGSWEPSAKEYGLFVKAVGMRYDGHYTPPGQTAPLPAVRFWSIWNEPNYGAQLAPQAVDNSTVEVSPLLYRELLDAAWTALGQTGHADDKILIGEIAPRGETTGDQPGNFSGMVPLRFIRALYCVDASLHPLQGTAATLRGCPATAAGSKAFPSQHPGLFHATGFAFHPYPQGQVTPNTPTPNEPDYADLPKLPEPPGDARRSAGGVRVEHPTPALRHRVRLPDQPARDDRARDQPDGCGLLHELGRVHQLEQPAGCLVGPVPAHRSASSEQFRHRDSSSPTASPRRPTTRSGCRCTCRTPRARRARRSRSGAACGRLAIIEGPAGREHPVRALERRRVQDDSARHGDRRLRLLRHARGVPVERVGANRVDTTRRRAPLQPHRGSNDQLGRRAATSQRAGLLSSAMALVRRLGTMTSVAAVAAGLALAPLPARAVAQTNQIAIFQDDARMLTAPGPTLQTPPPARRRRRPRHAGVEQIAPATRPAGFNPVDPASYPAGKLEASTTRSCSTRTRTASRSTSR